MCDGFLFSGGQDISPCRYNELPSRLTGPSSLLLDDYQLNLMKLVLDSKKPFIAICRGIQVLNVACGGTLYQDLTEFSPTVSKHMQETDRGDVSILSPFRKAPAFTVCLEIESGPTAITTSLKTCSRLTQSGGSLR